MSEVHLYDPRAVPVRTSLSTYREETILNKGLVPGREENILGFPPLWRFGALV